jgi:flagellar hook-associated protein 1 FlgK
VNLDAALSIANSGLANVQSQFGVISHNVANAGTPAYATEIGTQQSLDANGQGFGVRTGATTRQVDAALAASLTAQNGTVSGLQTQQTALQAIDAVQGAVGQGNDIGSLLNNLQSQFSTLLNSPDSQAQQTTVVGAAQTLAQGINSLSTAYTAQRQTAQDNIVAEVGTINTTLGTIGSLSQQIMTLQASGQSTADLENQRDSAVQTLSQVVGVKTLEQPNGDMLVVTNGGLTLPIHSANPLSTTGANVLPGSSYPGGGIQGIMLGGVDVTGQLQGGQIGANITLRDSTLPTFQGELDEFSQNLASRFSAQGLTLFTDPTGAVPAGGGVPVQNGYVGFAATIQVNPAVLATPSLVRDGTTAIAGSATGASAFTPNPAGGPAGFTTMIQRVLDNALGSDVQAGVAQPASNTTGLGATGTLSAPYTAPTTLAGIAATMVAAQSQASATTTTQLSTEQGVQTTLSSQLSSADGVNMDAEMSIMIQLQNAYGANAKVISTVQSMFTDIMNAVS